MVDILLALVLGIIEGITEFLPVSSSAHITLIARLFGLSSEEIELYAVVTQIGATCAILWHFRYEVLGLFFPRYSPSGVFSGIHGILICGIATLPALCVGYILKPIFTHIFAPWSLAVFLFLGALFIIAVESYLPHIMQRCFSLQEITYSQALYVGLFQCLSLFSGFSRSTATIMGALYLGFTRPVAVRFSFILAIPIMLGATLVKSVTLWHDLLPHIYTISLTTILACITSLLGIRFFLSFLESHSFIPFALYRIALSVILLAIII